MLQREAAPLRTQLVAKLREDIVAGRFGAGDRLIEKNLEAEYGVSRTVVREALRQLESERLVEIVPNIGPQVRALSYGGAFTSTRCGWLWSRQPAGWQLNVVRKRIFRNCAPTSNYWFATLPDFRLLTSVKRRTGFTTR